MPSQPIACPQCQAPLSLTPDRRFCQCPYCGTKFAITLPDGRSPRLARFESVLMAPASKAVAQSAEQRLTDLELTLADTEDDVESKRAEVAERKAAYWRTRVNLRRLVVPVQNTTYVAGLLAAVAAFATLFVFQKAERLPGALIAVLLAATAGAFHREWQGAELEGQGEIEEAQADVKEAEGELQGALAHLEDQTLERDLLQRQVIASTSWRAARAT